MTTQIVSTKNTNSTSVSYSATTGLSIVQSFLAKSGFNYQVGVRDFQGLLIIEGIVEGTACTYLSGIQVRDKESGEEICTIQVPPHTRYSRQVVVSLVQEHLSNKIADSAIKDGQALDMSDVRRQVADMLDECYFAESRQAALNWARRVGIIH